MGSARVRVGLVRGLSSWTQRAAAVAAVLLAAPTAGAAPRWDDVGDRIGVTLHHAGEIHAPGDPAWPAFPEIMGGGACWADFDRDGFLDLYLVNQQYNPENDVIGDWADAEDPTNALLLNEGDGRFRDATEDAAVASRSFGYGCSAADYDGDDDTDLYVAGFGVSQLYRNDGDGRFDDVTAAAGLDRDGACGAFECMSTSSAWADYDADGDLDLYVANYVDTGLHDLGRGPGGHRGQENWLFRNDHGTFTEVARAAGVAGLPADENGSKTLGVVWFDCDLDGDLDLYAANDGTPNDFYLNEGDGTFVERDEAGLADPRSSMGVAAADYDNDGYPDVFMTHYQAEDNGFYHNRGDCTFEDRSGEDDLARSFGKVGWGTGFVDLDRDADLDLVVANGHTEHFDPHYGQEIQVFRQDPNPEPGAHPWDRVWVDFSAQAGDGVAQARQDRVHRGAAFADYDWDGDVDIVTVNNNNESAKFLAGDGVADHWIQVDLAQAGSNRAAVGARVVVEVAGRAQVREVQAGSSYLSQNPTTVEFGLGAAPRADRVTVHWPAGGTTRLEGVDADQVIRVDRATGSYLTDTLAPRTRVQLAGVAGAGSWWRSTVTATVTASDRGVSDVTGVATTEAAVEGNAWAPLQEEAFVFEDEGIHRLSVRSADVAGNLEPRRTTTIGIDRTPPSVGHDVVAHERGVDDWWLDNQALVTLSAEDALSGVAEIRYRLKDQPWNAYAGPFVVSGEGVHRVEMTAQDAAGNEAATESFLVKLDRTRPHLEVKDPAAGAVYLGPRRILQLPNDMALVVSTPDAGEAGGSDFAVRVDARDRGSGLARVEVALNGALRAVDEDPPYEWTWRTSDFPAGVHVLGVVAVDKAGNRALDERRVALVAATPEGLNATVADGPALAGTPVRLEPLPSRPAWLFPAVGEPVRP